MRRRKSISKLLTVALLVASLAHTVAARGVPGYDAAVKLVETYYKAKHRGIPFAARAAVGVAKVVSKDVRRIARYGDIKVAVFADQDFTARGSSGEFHALLRQKLAPHWSQLIAVRGAERLFYMTDRTVTGAPAISAGVVYFGSTKGLYGLDAATGRQLRWFPTERIVTTAPAPRDGLVYFGGWDATLYAVN